MNGFDQPIIHFLNGFVGRSIAADNVISFFTHNILVTGGFTFSLFWYAWFRYDQRENREILLFGLLASVLSLAAARLLALSLPFRLRPMYNPALHFRLPQGVDSTDLINWSSFPSDHAAVFFAVAGALWFASRPVGILALCHALFVVSLPNIYTGIHYPTDVIAGALIGFGCAALCNFVRLRGRVTRPGLSWMTQSAGTFYAALFLCTFEIGELFNSVRHMVLHGLQILRLF